MLDYITNNYRTLPLFVDKDHPSKYLMYEIIREITELLGITMEEKEKYKPMLGIPMVIHPQIKKHFNLDFKVPCETASCILEDSMEMNDYIRCYMWWQHEKYLA